jgi:hypothetical protein
LELCLNPLDKSADNCIIEKTTQHERKKMKFYILETNSEKISLFQVGKVYYIGIPNSTGRAWIEYHRSTDRKYIENIWKKSFKLF